MTPCQILREGAPDRGEGRGVLVGVSVGTSVGVLVVRCGIPCGPKGCLSGSAVESLVMVAERASSLPLVFFLHSSVTYPLTQIVLN